MKERTAIKAGRFSFERAYKWICLPLLLSLFSCDGVSRKEEGEHSFEQAASRAESVEEGRPSSERSVTDQLNREPTAVERKESEPESCAEGQNRVPGGAFWVGSKTPTYENEENPRFKTQVATFCVDRTEVTAARYQACVDAGGCTPPRGQGKRCTFGNPGKVNHPINCLSYEQAEAVCEHRSARLPTEIEWEYVARGGAAMQSYPWGEESPDGHACWKHHETCEVGRFGAAAFGLQDVVGNVWEWTSSAFAPYPWPRAEGALKVYRGGSWSRRFEKWMKPTLRNRVRPSEQGSHLGVRCVKSLFAVECPYGRGVDGGCLFGIDEVECGAGQIWNGARCARSKEEPLCAEGTQLEPGRGCRGGGAIALPRPTPRMTEATTLTSVERTRGPEFDEDCQKNQPRRPHAYLFKGGDHGSRNAAGVAFGCKNRDVGVGWNSACCP